MTTVLNHIQEVKLAIKSQFGAEFRRFSIVLGAGKPVPSYEEFIVIIQVFNIIQNYSYFIIFNFQFFKDSLLT